MVQGYYTLEEASQILGMDIERLNQMAQKREIRAFADRGTWRFRTQDVEEMARRLGLGSSPDLQLGEADKFRATPSPVPKSGAKAPSPPPKSGAKGPEDEGIFDFSVGSTPDPSEIDHEIVIESPTSQKKGSKPPAALSPTPKPGSDSDVHLVFDVGGEFSPVDDSNVKLEDAKGPKSSGPKKAPARPDAGKAPPKKPARGSQLDSGVRLVPMDEDSAVPLGQNAPSSGTDSDIRLDKSRADDRRRAAADLANTTEDINLDEELKRADELSKGRKPRSKVKPKSEAKKSDPDGPFELLETGLETPALPDTREQDDSDKTAEIHMESEDDAVNLGEIEPGGSGNTNVRTGINLHSPADGGVDLEKEDPSSDSLEFELSLEPEGTPKPTSEAPEGDSSGEFELTLEEGGAEGKAEEAAEAGSEDEIFETDFDMPAVEEGAEEAAAAAPTGDTELESSDFELSLGEEEDSGSQVVALEGEEADEGAATVAYKGRKAEAPEEEAAEEIEDLLAEDEIPDLEGEEEFRGARPVAVAAAPAEWGKLPALVLFPSVLIMFLLACMGFELLNNMWGYKQAYKPSGMLVRTFANWIGEKPPD